MVWQLGWEDREWPSQVVVCRADPHSPTSLQGPAGPKGDLGSTGPQGPPGLKVRAGAVPCDPEGHSGSEGGTGSPPANLPSCHIGSREP